MTGLREALTRLKSDVWMREIRVRVRVLSADVAPGQQERLKAERANGYLTKPIDVTQLSVLVDQTLAVGLRKLS